MQVYNIDVIVDDEAEKKLLQLEERFKNINGWTADKLLTFAFNAHAVNIDFLIQLIEAHATSCEKSIEKGELKTK